MRIDETSAALEPASLEETEMDLLLEGIHRLFGYDFRQYARATVKRRLIEVMIKRRLENLSELQGKILRDSQALNAVVSALSIQVSSLFRDAKFYSAFRRKAIPILKTYPSVRIWHAGCASGEEVYSMAILLAEEGVLNRCRLYATDLNVNALETASRGLYSTASVTEAENSYRASGGSRSLSDYFQTSGKGVDVHSGLRERITFFPHNLATDGSFNEFHVILCRNVLIYFGKPLQDRVHKLLYDSLVRLGILGLGANETLHLTPKAKYYRPLDERAHLYRRID
jgi:chemotaxis protein methyltransferase CheR